MILVGDFSAKLLKWCPSNKDNKAGQDIDTFTTTSGYAQMIGQSTHIVNDKSSSCSVMLESSKQFIIDSIIILYMDHLISTYLLLHVTTGKFRITKTQIRYVYSVQFH